MPRRTNGSELYKKAGCDWATVDMTKFKTYSNAESWKDIPQEAIDYLCSLPEFVADIFTKITEIKLDDDVAKAIKLLESKGKIQDGKIIT